MTLRIFHHESKPVRSVTGAGAAIAAIAMSMLMTSSAGDAQAAPGGSAPIDTATITSAPMSMSTVAAEGKTLHITIGHSVFIDNKTRLRRVYVSDPAVLNSVTLSPNKIIVTAMAPGVSSLTLLDETGQAQSYVVSSDVDIATLRVAMAQAMRSNAVTVDGSGGHVVLSGTVGTPESADAAVKLATLYAKDVSNALTVIATHPKQVRLEVRILEVDRTKALQLGVNLFNPGGNTSFLAGTTTGQYPSTQTLTTSGAGNLGGILLTTSNPLNFMLYSTKLNLGTTIQDLQTKQVLQILAEPTITTVSGVKANFLSGGQFPFPVVQPGNGAGSSPVVSIQFRDYGVKVEFTPIVNEDGTIRLHVTPEVSALDYSNAVTVSGFTIPALSTRKADTEVELRSNQSFAISGLLDQRTTDLMNKTPGAANIPILGALFKSKNTNHSTTELVVVVTPTVVDPLTENGIPAEPDLPIPTLNTGSFDKSLGKDRNPHPAPPPIVPGQPPFGELTPPAVPAPATATATSAQAAAAQGAPAAAASANQATTVPVAAPPQVSSIAPAVQPSKAEVHAVAAPATSRAPETAPVRPPASIPVAAAARSKVPAASAMLPPANASTAMASMISPVPQMRSASAPSIAVAPAPSPNIATVHPMVEVMALSHAADADAMVAALKRHGYNVAVNRDPQDSLLHLDVGPFASKADAETVRQRLLVDGYNATIK